MAPNPAATLAAFEPTTPPPSTAISAGAHSRHAGQEDSPALLGAFEKLGPLLDAHPTGDFAHGREQGEPPRVVLESFVRDRRDAALDDRARQAFVGGEMEVGEEELPGPQAAAIPRAEAP